MQGWVLVLCSVGTGLYRESSILTRTVSCMDMREGGYIYSDSDRTDYRGSVGGSPTLAMKSSA